jgi:uncharacterized protein YecE (DUF72 family)
MAAGILIGSSGYSYKDWVGVFYPDGLRPSDYLEFYALHFSFVELNFSYYAQPSPSAIAGLLARTPPAFMFSIKTHRSLTHDRNDDWRAQAAVFRRGIQPLAESGRLAGLVAQFPFSFHYNPDNRRFLADLCAEFAAYPFCVEFRNAEWLTDRVVGELAARGARLVLTDTPDLPGLPTLARYPAGSIAAAGYVRFHGRNGQNWWKGDSTSRYDYLYSREELEKWLPLLRGSARPILPVAFNNHARGRAVANAKDLQLLLAEADSPT